MVDFSVSINLQCYALLLLVVVSAYYLCKASLAQDTLDLESVQDVVTWLHCEITIGIIHSSCALLE